MSKNIETIKVNVGCGPKSKRGWINVDIQDLPSVDRVMDVTKSWPFRNVDVIYAEHFLEHLFLRDGINFLYNAGLSLKVGGKIRISTPNVEWVLKTHYKMLGKTKGSEAEYIDSVTAINRAFYGWGHRFLYSPFLLKKLLEDVGYENLSFCSYGESTHESLRNLEEHGGYSLFDNSPSVIIVEATRSRRLIQFPESLFDQLKNGFIRYNEAVG